MSEANEVGRRERKKRRTREMIADVALGLFMQRGFEAVTVAEVAHVADVAVNTVFNYFPTKEDLFFDRQAEVEGSWSRIVRERKAGESVVTALRRDYLDALAQRDPRSWLNDALVPFSRLIQSSATLLAREREIGDRAEANLATTLAEETGATTNDLTPQVVASLIHGVYRTLIEACRRRLLAGERADAIYPDMLAAAQQAFGLLEAGVGDYAKRKP